ncbi:MAG: AMP-binding protein [Candidatus Promineofilum sp.]|nr:AMP-binding protein [Promineifilum sp.]
MMFLERLADNCRRLPDKTALEFIDGGRATAVTYGQLELGIQLTMAHLRARGVEPGDRVALQLPKCLPFILLHLATMRLGAISLPLNAGYPPHELSYFLRDAEAGLFYTDAAAQESLLPALAELPALRETVFLDLSSSTQFDSLIADCDPNDAAAIGPPDADTTCLMIYTSGTTGRPKGAELTHRNLTANLDALREAWGWREDDVLLHVLPIFHVHGLIVALHGALHVGATTVLLSRFDPVRTLQTLCDRRCTLLMAVPAIHRRLVNAPHAAGYDLSHVRLITSGSDRLPDDLFLGFRETFGHVLLERYGMSETGMLISNPLQGERRVGSVGRPLPGVAVRIVHPETEEPLADGEVGAVQVRGANVFKGYWRQPEKTAAAFTPDGWFRTGDLGLREPDGYITLKGRSRDLIISGGYNIYPPEVELALAEHPAVAAVAVIGCPDEEWGEIVTAVIVPRPGMTLTPEAIMTYCRGYLINYKIPRRVIVVDDLPRNALGKVQKAMLRQELCGQPR